MWTMFGILYGLFLNVPSGLHQMIWTLLYTGLTWTEIIDPDGDFADCGTILIFILGCRTVHGIMSDAFDYVCPDCKPRLDRAPYLLNGGAYGYSMSQYHIKPKSGHGRPKTGGKLQPITTRTLTHRLAHIPFDTALTITIIYLIASTNHTLDLWWTSSPDYSEANVMLDYSKSNTVQTHLTPACSPDGGANQIEYTPWYSRLRSCLFVKERCHRWLD